VFRSSSAVRNFPINVVVSGPTACGETLGFKSLLVFQNEFGGAMILGLSSDGGIALETATDH